MLSKTTMQTGWKRVGYLKASEDYPHGEVSELAFERLVGLVRHRLLFWAGYHYCELHPCGSAQPPPEFRYKGLVIPTKCDHDILVPARTFIYVAPALILHYIRVHKYLPSSSFLEAVLACPDPASSEYLAALEKIDGRYHDKGSLRLAPWLNRIKRGTT